MDLSWQKQARLEPRGRSQPEVLALKHDRHYRFQPQPEERYGVYRAWTRDNRQELNIIFNWINIHKSGGYEKPCCEEASDSLCALTARLVCGEQCTL